MKVLALVLAATLLGAAPAQASDLGSARPASGAVHPMVTATTRTAVHLGGVTARIRPRTRQVVTVRHRTGWHATVRLWRHTADGWQRVLTARDGRTGYGGLVRGERRVQGTGTTPLGTYSLPWAFGTHPRADRWRLGYRRIGAGDFWVEDNGSRYYNRWRNQALGGFRWWLAPSRTDSSERLTDYPVQYEYAVVTGFNHEQVRHRGAGIFVHVNGRAATAGCVSAPRWFVRALLRRLDPDLHPVVAIGR